MGRWGAAACASFAGELQRQDVLAAIPVACQQWRPRASVGHRSPEG
ncbi:hypothetical protein ACP70R_014542 [Stipagrostis hirtigluma subsp. patula]